MLYQKVLIFTLFLFTQLHATPCESPSTATDSLTDEFRYGCFCGRDYPDIEHPSKINYKSLNLELRQELVEQYEKVDAFDDIDQLCKEHDICFIEQGKDAKICNNNIYRDLSKLEKKFRKADSSDDKNRQCKNLAYDIRSVFHTVFAPADEEDSIFDVGVLMLNGAMTVMNKVFLKSVNSMNEDAYYPDDGEKCLLEESKKQ